MMVKDYTRAVLDRHGKEAALLLNQLRPMLEQGRTSDALTAIAWAIDMRSNSYPTDRRNRDKNPPGDSTESEF